MSKQSTEINSVVVPLDRENIDTDAILPKQFLKRTEKSGFGKYLFYNWRFNEDKSKKTNFVLNQPQYKEASILLTRENFGCGSSREHAAWSLYDYGFKAIIAPSYADIFHSNAFKNGVLLVKLDYDTIDFLFKKHKENPTMKMSIDIEGQFVYFANNKYYFEIKPYLKNMVLKGMDEIDMILEHEDKIQSFESAHSIKMDLLSKN